MPPDPRKLSDWLNSQPAAIQDALSLSQHLSPINRALHEWLREPWAQSIRLARIDGETAVFFASNASASTLLHFHSAAVLAFLRDRCNCNCDRIQIRVRPEAYTPV
jgi:hypothetical protein